MYTYLYTYIIILYAQSSVWYVDTACECNFSQYYGSKQIIFHRTIKLVYLPYSYTQYTVGCTRMRTVCVNIKFVISSVNFISTHCKQLYTGRYLFKSQWSYDTKQVLNWSYIVSLYFSFRFMFFQVISIELTV